MTVQAVGRVAVDWVPISIVIPCYRVVGNNNSLIEDEEEKYKISSVF